MAWLFLLLAVVILLAWVGQKYWSIYSLLLTLALGTATFIYHLNSHLNIDL